MEEEKIMVTTRVSVTLKPVEKSYSSQNEHRIQGIDCSVPTNLVDTISVESGGRLLVFNLAATSKYVINESTMWPDWNITCVLSPKTANHAKKQLTVRLHLLIVMAKQ